jgi:hypothetical protein
MLVASGGAVVLMVGRRGDRVADWTEAICAALVAAAFVVSVPVACLPSQVVVTACGATVRVAAPPADARMRPLLFDGRRCCPWLAISTPTAFLIGADTAATPSATRGLARPGSNPAVVVS